MDTSQLQYNPTVEKIVDILVNKTQNYNRDFFRLQANFYVALVASTMGIRVNTPFTGTIPVNFYGVNLASSGSGKGFSTNMLENQILEPFRVKFIHDIFPNKVKLSLDSEAMNRAASLGISHQEAYEKLEKEFKSYGAFKFTFDSATSPAIKQFRHKLLLAKLGSINFIIDEIGSNLKSNIEPLTTFLELYDKGLVKDKLTKSTQDNVRHIELIGSTPSNLLMFGSPSKLLDGSSVEDDFFSLLETGYARRCFFAFSKKDVRMSDLSPEDLYDMMANKTQDQDLFNISSQIEALANLNLCNMTVNVPKDVGVKLVAYRIECEKAAEELPEHQEILKSEISHRYFKVLKLAAAYAFLEGKLELEETHLNQAIKFAEHSGTALTAMLEREKPYERLAKFIADGRGKQFTQVDLVEELPYYKGTISQKNELLSMAIAWGYSNHILIKKSLGDNGIEFISGEGLHETDLSKIKIAYSQDFADGYINAEIDWNTAFDKLLPMADYHWTNHHSVNGKRSNETMVQGCNVVVLDVDGGITLNQAQNLLQDYEYIIHTTKRHQVPDETGSVKDRFRVILPMNYEVNLSEPEYKQFMQNVAKWCPFELDTQTFQRSRKWACTENTTIYKNNGKLLDILPFIPRTSRENEFSKQHEALGSMDNIERWFAQQMQMGNRNNQMIKFALMLLDGGMHVNDVIQAVYNFNSKLTNPLSEDELQSTIFKTVLKKGTNNE